MADGGSRDVTEDVQDLLDGLIQQLCPGWECVLPERLEANHARHELIAAKRMQVARALQRSPDQTLALAEQVLAAIVADEDPSCNRQLVEPLVAAVGRRAVLAGLLSYVQSGSPAQKAGAVRGWYWAQPTVVYASSADFRARRPTLSSRGEADEVADLRRLLRTACLTAFLTTEDAQVRAELAMWFTLNPGDYPPAIAGSVDHARRVAAGDPQRYHRLLANTTEPGLTQLGERPSGRWVPDP
jgi:hypothetical protein